MICGALAGGPKASSGSGPWRSLIFLFRIRDVLILIQEAHKLVDPTVPDPEHCIQ